MAWIKPRPEPGKIPVATADIPEWRYGFHVEDNCDPQTAAEAEMRAAHADWQRKCKQFDDTHSTPSMAELLADEQAMSDTPFDPYAEIEAGTL